MPYLIQDPGHSVKQDSKEAALEERPFGLVGVQGCGAQRPAPGGDAGAALLKLKPGAGRLVEQREGVQGSLGQSSSTQAPKGSRWEPAEPILTRP